MNSARDLYPFDVAAGTIVRLGDVDWKYGNTRRGNVVVRVEKVRWDLFSGLWSGGHVWIEGHRMEQCRDQELLPDAAVSIFVSVNALRRELS